MDSPKNQTCADENLLRRSLSEGLAAAKKHQTAGWVLWSFGCLVVGGYYLVPSFHGALKSLGEWKQQSTFVFAAISTGIFGGLVPSLIRRFNRSSATMNHYTISNSLFWAFKGVEIELLYQLQAATFGDQTNWTIVAVKTGFDQFVYVPTIGIVNVVLFFLFRECRYQYSLFKNRLGPDWYIRRILPVLIANWLIWIPAVVLIYCFPQALQLPVQNLILCFWVLILTFVTNRAESNG